MAIMHSEEILRWRGEDLIGRDGEKIGQIQEIYLDNETNQPEWALVHTGLFGLKSSFVPIRDASRETDRIRVPYDKAQVKDAPKVDPDGQLSQREEAQLYRHYDMEYSQAPRDVMTRSEGGMTRSEGGMTRSEGGMTRSEGGTTRSEEEGTARDAMTRSEEELRVGTAQREAGRVRLRKYVETEDVHQTVPVRREEPRVEREPVTDANVDQATAGPDISEDEHEVVLHEEEVVAQKRAEPKERVRLETDTVTDERDVSDTVRKERIEVEDSGRGGR